MVAPVTVGEKVIEWGGNVLATVKDHITFIGDMMTSSENLDKIAKIAVAAIDVVTLSVGASVGLKTLRGRIKELRDIFVVSQVVYRIKEWLFNKKGAHAPFWKIDSPLSVVAHAIYTTGQVIEIAQIIERFGAWTLGTLSKATGIYSFFGGLVTTTFPLVSIFKDSLYMISATMQVVDKAIIISKCGAKKDRHTFKIGKWEEHVKLVEKAFPNVCKKNTDDEDDSEPDVDQAKQAQNALKRRYEAKICANQIQLQQEMLEYIGAKHNSQVSHDVDIEPFDSSAPKNLQIEYLHRTVRDLKENTGRILAAARANALPADFNMSEFCGLLAQLQRGLKHTESNDKLTDNERVRLRNVVLELNTSLYDVTAMLAEADFQPNYEESHPELFEKVKKIDKLYDKLTELQRSYKMVCLKNGTGLAEVYKISEWKKAKWEARECNNQLQEKKAWAIIVDMICKIVGGALSLICTVVPLLAIGRAVAEIGGTIVEHINPEAASAIHFVRGFGAEAFKTAIAVFSAGAAYHFTKETHKEKGVVKAIPARPTTQRVKGLPNPLKERAKAMEVLIDVQGQPQVEAKHLREILKLVRSVHCGTMQRDQNTYFKISAACAA